MHFMALHVHGSSNPVGISGNVDRLPMHGYFIFKDLITVFVFILIFSLFIFFSPNTLGQQRPLLYMKYIILQCAICWKYSGYLNLNYNKTILILISIFIYKYNISDLLLIIYKCQTKYRIYQYTMSTLLYKIIKYIVYKINDILLIYKNINIKFYANPLIVKYYYNEYNQQITKIFNKILVGISETIRTQKVLFNELLAHNCLLDSYLFLSPLKVNNNTLFINSTNINHLDPVAESNGYNKPKDNDISSIKFNQ